MLARWAKDTHSPFRAQAKVVTLAISTLRRVALKFCPFCGGGGKVNKLCRCGLLDCWAALPSTRVALEPVRQEYTIKAGKGDSFILRHCPGCGGRLPQSLRSKEFASLSTADRLRCRALLKDAQSLDQVISILGQPDAAGEVPSATRERARRIGAKCPLRFARYTRLSPKMALTVVEIEGGPLQAFCQALPKPKRCQKE